MSYEFREVELDVPDYLKFVENLVSKVLDESEEIKLNAGFSGRKDDGGARIIKNEILIYRAALDKKIPDKWFKYYEEFVFNLKLEEDPEYKDDYAEYLRLKSKFEGVDVGTD